MIHEQNTKTLEKMLELAQFGAEGHRTRWKVEFRVFISYITVLLLSLYQVNRPKDPINTYFVLPLAKEHLYSINQ